MQLQEQNVAKKSSPDEKKTKKSLAERGKSIAKKASESLIEVKETGIKKAKDVKEVSEKTVKSVKKATKAIQESAKSLDDPKPKKSNRKEIQLDPVQKAEDVWNQMNRAFWNILIFIAAILVSFLLGGSNGIFRVLGFILLIALPFYILYVVVTFIPEIKIGGRTFSIRKRMSFQNQVKYGGKAMKLFSKEMIRNSPEIAAIFFVLAVLLILTIIGI